MSQQPMKRFWCDPITCTDEQTGRNSRPAYTAADVEAYLAEITALRFQDGKRLGVLETEQKFHAALAAKEAVCESYEADRKLAVAGERQCFTTYQCAHRQRTIKALQSDLARLKQRVKELEKRCQELYARTPSGITEAQEEREQQGSILDARGIPDEYYE